MLPKAKIYSDYIKIKTKTETVLCSGGCMENPIAYILATTGDSNTKIIDKRKGIA